MRILNLAVVSFVVFTFFAISVDAQRRTTTRRTTPPRVVTTNPTPPAANIAELNEGAEKVSIQIKNLSKFLYVLGGVARGIEDIDKDQRANRAAIDANNENKRNTIQTIRNLRAGLAVLEVEFRTKPGLKPHLSKIQGITDLTAQSEDLAIAGRFVDSGKPLLQVVEQLADTLAAMR
jgi:hypothetical protein